AEDVLLRLLSITHHSLPDTIQSLKCRRCAVVGNGHRLRNSSMGDTIDSYDVVIRYGPGAPCRPLPSPAFPCSAPARPCSMGDTIDSYDLVIRYCPGRPLWAVLQVRKGFWKQPPLIWDANPERVRILNPYYMEVTAAKLLNLPMRQPRKVKQKPTTGLLAITLALHFCDLVHIAGFGYPDSANKKQTIHYYEQITLKSMAASEHNVSHEAVAIKKMLELGLVKNLTYF
ncbi:SIA4C sialyltransferase, partial [Indicator maculatus]|nr:SIA4C sialyltransferase [Indicator maculatus]